MVSTRLMVESLEALIRLEERFRQPERKVIWSELGKEPSRRPVLMIPIPAVTGGMHVTVTCFVSSMAQSLCCEPDAYTSQSWMPSEVCVLWPMPQS